jgi:hypothetical protein
VKQRSLNNTRSSRIHSRDRASKVAAGVDAVEVITIL